MRGNAQNITRGAGRAVGVREDRENYEDHEEVRSSVVRERKARRSEAKFKGLVERLWKQSELVMMKDEIFGVMVEEFHDFRTASVR